MAAQPRLVGTHEIQAEHGVPRHRVARLLHRGMWPRPAAELACGRIWRASDVDRQVAKLKRDGQL